MALIKEIKGRGGVITTYHRIVSVDKVTNVQNTIEIASYLDKSAREEEIQHLEDLRNADSTDDVKGVSIFIDGRYIVMPYDPNITISEVYEKLKELPEFEGAEDEN